MAEEISYRTYINAVSKANRAKYDTYSRQNVPFFESVNELREFFLANFVVELSAAKTTSSFNGRYRQQYQPIHLYNTGSRI